MKKSSCIGLLAFLFGVIQLFSQVPGSTPNLTVDDAVNYINSKIKGTAQVKNQRGELFIEFFDKGKVVRKDKVPFTDLNPATISYLPDEKAIVLRCNTKDCIDRDVVVPRSHGQFSRISIQGDFDEKTQNGLINAFEHIILTFSDSKYKSNKPFER